MNDPTATWGIPGALFLVLFVVLAAASLALPHLVAAWTARRHDDPQAGEPDLDLTTEQLAHLAGGAHRAVEASVAGLVDRGRLRVARDRRLSPVTEPAAGQHPDTYLDDTVMSAVGAGARVPHVLSTVGRARAVDTIRESLVARGLLHDPALLRSRIRLAYLAPALVGLLGLARLGAGLGRGAAVGYLITALLFFAVIGYHVIRAVNDHRPTTRGTATLRAVREAQRDAVEYAGDPHRSAALPVALAGAAGLVAVGGLMAFPDDETSSFLAFSPGGGGGGFGGGGCGGGGGGGGCGGGGGGCGG